MDNRSVVRFSLRWMIVAFVGLFVLLTVTEPVHAQAVPSRDPRVFKAQLLQYMEVTRKNLRDIQALPADDPAPLDPGLRARAHDAYDLIRAARMGLEAARGYQTSYRDPMLDLAQKRLDEAWNLTRWTVDFWSAERPLYINQSVQNLSRSLRLVQQALTILP